ncbi:MAG: NYN domain-containing protein [Candidatus Heimdallarchaeota archaeon]|nr:NYN domain-containing protein [Candidatus Heimdallarchaeota archaeon]
MAEIEEETAEEKKLVERITNRILNSSYIQNLRLRISSEKKLAVFVDGPNFLRKVKNRQIRLEEIDDKIENMGNAVVRKVFLNEFATDNLIKAITNSGYEPIVSPQNIYILMSIEIMKVIEKGIKPDIIVIASRHARISPILLKVKEKGIETVVIGFEPGFSVAVKKTADLVFSIE